MAVSGGFLIEIIWARVASTITSCCLMPAEVCIHQRIVSSEKEFFLHYTAVYKAYGIHPHKLSERVSPVYVHAYMQIHHYSLALGVLLDHKKGM